MRSMVRFIAALVVGMLVAIAGVLAFGEIESGGVAWLGLLVVAGFIASLVDRDHFYGTGSQH